MKFELPHSSNVIMVYASFKLTYCFLHYHLCLHYQALLLFDLLRHHPYFTKNGKNGLSIATSIIIRSIITNYVINIVTNFMGRPSRSLISFTLRFMNKSFQFIQLCFKFINVLFLLQALIHPCLPRLPSQHSHHRRLEKFSHKYITKLFW